MKSILLKNLIEANKGSRQIYLKGINADEKIKQIFDKHFTIAKSWAEKNVYFYRGSKNYFGKLTLINPKLITRKSKDSYNLYYVLMDTLPSWSNFPKRSKSIIFTSKKEIAISYNTSLNYLYVYDRAKVAYGEYNKDGFLSTPYIYGRIGGQYKSVYLFSMELTKLIKLLGKLYEDSILEKCNEKIDNNTWLKITERIKTIDFKKMLMDSKEKISLHISVSFVNDIIDYMKNGDIVSYLDDLFNPVKNNFNVVSTKKAYEIISEEPREYEFWTDGLVMMKYYYD